MAKALMLLRMEMRGTNHGKEFAIFKYLECSSPGDTVDKVLSSVRPW